MLPNGRVMDVFNLKNETLSSPVAPIYVTEVILDADQHDSFHSSIPGSASSYPHTYLYTPVHREVENSDSDIVAVLISIFAWDVAMRDLLPPNVGGIVAVLENTCNQTFTYHIR